MLVVPEYLQRNGPKIAEVGYDATGESAARQGARAHSPDRQAVLLGVHRRGARRLRGPDAHTLLRAHYGRSFMETLLANTGWSVDGFYPRDRARYIAANVWLFRRPV
jgi:hypothetical protein